MKRVLVVVLLVALLTRTTSTTWWWPGCSWRLALREAGRGEPSPDGSRPPSRSMTGTNPEA